VSWLLWLPVYDTLHYQVTLAKQSWNIERRVIQRNSNFLITCRPTNVWGPVALVALIAAMTVLALFSRDRAFFAWDVTVAGWVMDIPGPGVNSLMEAVSWAGVKPAIVVMVLTATALATRFLGWRAGLLVFSVLIITAANEEFKEIIGRPRPNDVDGMGNKSFPSGHALYASLLMGVTWLLVAPRLPKQSHRLSMAGIFVAWVLVTGVSRIHLEKHWPSDVLGAYLLGAALILVMAWAIPVLNGIRRSSHEPSTEEGEAS